ncbi:MAG TPA: hypothetical protein VIX82_14625 [Solirubrobacteraceae bacterium]
MEHWFTGPAYTIGIEEELMILDTRADLPSLPAGGDPTQLPRLGRL